MPSKGTSIYRISLFNPKYIGPTKYRMSVTEIKHFTSIINLHWQNIIRVFNDIHKEDYCDVLKDNNIIFNQLPYTLPIPDYSLLKEEK